jgi:hypothetical protein
VTDGAADPHWEGRGWVPGARPARRRNLAWTVGLAVCSAACVVLALTMGVLDQPAGEARVDRLAGAPKVRARVEPRNPNECLSADRPNPVSAYRLRSCVAAEPGTTVDLYVDHSGARPRLVDAETWARANPPPSDPLGSEDWLLVLGAIVLPVVVFTRLVWFLILWARVRRCRWRRDRPRSLRWRPGVGGGTEVITGSGQQLLLHSTVARFALERGVVHVTTPESAEESLVGTPPYNVVVVTSSGLMFGGRRIG